MLRITHMGAMAFLARLFGGRMTRSYLKQEAEGLKARVEQGRSRSSRKALADDVLIRQSGQGRQQ